MTGEIDVAEALAWRNEVVSNWDDSGQLPWLEDRGIELIRGYGRIKGKGLASVGAEEVEAEKIVVATGSSAAIPPIDGLRDLEGVWTNREVTGMKEVPKSILVLGGGPVGVEMSQVLTRFGSKVTLVEASDRVLSREAPAAGETLAEALEDEGVELRLDGKASGGRSGRRGLHPHPRGRRGADRREAAGRDRAHPEHRRRPRRRSASSPASAGIEVDERMRAGRRRLGDRRRAPGSGPSPTSASTRRRSPPRTCSATRPAPTTARSPASSSPTPRSRPSASPRAEQTGTGKLADLARTSTYARNGEQKGFLTLVSDGTKLTGAYAVGPEAGDWLGQATLAVRAGVPLDLLRDTIQPYPTFSEVFASALSDLS